MRYSCRSFDRHFAVLIGAIDKLWLASMFGCKYVRYRS